MKLVFYSLVLNHHQACVADEFYRMLGSDFAFVETAECHDLKGSTEFFSKRPYLIKAWESQFSWSKAMNLAQSADVCVFGGYEALPFEKERMKYGLLSFDMGERMLKRGWLNLLSPRIFKMITIYHFEGWKHKPLYKLCMSAFAKKDQYKLFSFKNKCYKWGYLINIDDKYDVEYSILKNSSLNTIQIMWCGRFLILKHPELPVLMAKILKDKGYKFCINMYGDEDSTINWREGFSRKRLIRLIDSLHVDDCVHLMGKQPNEIIQNVMQQSSIFLFTSDYQEGWGVVANEALANGCALVASNAIGSIPYLIEDGVNGFVFKNGDLNSLTSKVEWLINHPEEMHQLQKNACYCMKRLWSPHTGAKALLQLIDDLKNNRETSIKEGPCSKA